MWAGRAGTAPAVCPRFKHQASSALTKVAMSSSLPNVESSEGPALLLYRHHLSQQCLELRRLCSDLWQNCSPIFLVYLTSVGEYHILTLQLSLREGFHHIALRTWLSPRSATSFSWSPKAQQFDYSRLSSKTRKKGHKLLLSSHGTLALQAAGWQTAVS